MAKKQQQQAAAPTTTTTTMQYDRKKSSHSGRGSALRGDKKKSALKWNFINEGNFLLTELFLKIIKKILEKFFRFLKKKHIFC